VAIKRWRPSRTYTKQEQVILKRVQKKRNSFGSLRNHREEIFDDKFQAELEAMYRETGAGEGAGVTGVSGHGVAAPRLPRSIRLGRGRSDRAGSSA